VGDGWIAGPIVHKLLMYLSDLPTILRAWRLL